MTLNSNGKTDPGTAIHQWGILVLPERKHNAFIFFRILPYWKLPKILEVTAPETCVQLGLFNTTALSSVHKRGLRKTKKNHLHHENGSSQIAWQILGMHSGSNWNCFKTHLPNPHTTQLPLPEISSHEQMEMYPLRHWSRILSSQSQTKLGRNTGQQLDFPQEITLQNWTWAWQDKPITSSAKDPQGKTILWVISEVSHCNFHQLLPSSFAQLNCEATDRHKFQN